MTIIFALLTALWLGIMTSISPCPLATNIAAVSFISKRFNSRTQMLLNGFLYTIGRTGTYFVLSLLIIGGLLSIPSLSAILQGYIAKVLGPLLVLVGMFLLDLFSLPAFGNVCGDAHSRLAGKGLWGPFLLGVIFALAFCPSSAAIFFGALIPLALDKQSTIGMPILYGIGTGLPVIIVAFLIAFGFAEVGKLFHNIVKLELWVRRITGGLFIIIGTYYILTHIFGVTI